ncbi:MAG TPA: DNA-3-methyladenine glycosylase [Gemmatimonadaceae bacterium]|nr:DNA-3-methyladenine glycosylase [Gemmatimonadaceae bacterium]
MRRNAGANAPDHPAGSLLHSRPRSAFHRGRVLPRDFYARETELVARDLLGTVLECETPDGLASGIIVETEAYLGEHDEACHAVAGRTARTEPLYGPPGTSYVYFIYGMYWCFNAVTREEGLPSAVLVRALEPLDGVDLMQRRRPRAESLTDLTSGPGKLCSALGIVGSMSSMRLQRKPIVIRAGEPIPDTRVRVTTRIGITRCADWPMRWIVDGNPYVSKGKLST